MVMGVDSRRLHPMSKKDDAELIVACNSRWSTPDGRRGCGLHAEMGVWRFVCVPIDPDLPPEGVHMRRPLKKGDEGRGAAMGAKWGVVCTSKFAHIMCNKDQN